MLEIQQLKMALCEDYTNDDCDIKYGKAVDYKYHQFYTIWGHCISIVPDINLFYRGPVSYMRIVVDISNSLVLYNKMLNNSEARDLFKGISAGIVYSVYDSELQMDIHRMFYHVNLAKVDHSEEVQLTKTHFQRLNTSSRPCFKMEDVVQCGLNCINSNLTQYLSPCLHLLLTEDIPKHCATFNASYLTYSKLMHFYNGFDRANCNCEIPCNQTDYSFRRVVRKPKEDERHRHHNTHVDLKLYYLDNHYESTIQVYKYSVFDFMSNVGSQLGFYLAFCVLSIVEILDTLFHFIYFWLRHHLFPNG